jgi:hypothetical protein
MDQNRRENPGQQNEEQQGGRSTAVGADRSQDRPNQNANKEPAEGSRETVRANQGQQGAGITNRPLEREQSEQAQVPPRGKAKEEDRLNLDEESSRRDAGREIADTGHTSGGGSLGHNQPDAVRRDTPTRNATGSEKDPVMPKDDSTLKTKI